jgi:hypothetical protein
MVLLSSLTVAIADTWYLMYGKRSLPTTLPAAFPGLEIRDGVLFPHQSPYIPPSYLISPVLNQLIKLPVLLNHEADSLIVVDTAEIATIAIKIPMALLKSRKMVVHLNDKTTMEFPYELDLFGTRNIKFTSDELLKHLKQYIFGIFMGYFFSAVFHDSIVFLFSIFFLALAAFVFRMDRERLFKEYLKVAVFSISPLIVGGVLAAFSGVKFEWLWHVLIFLSVIVMFRAIVAISNSNIDIGSRI